MDLFFKKMLLSKPGAEIARRSGLSSATRMCPRFDSGPEARFWKFPVITGPVKLFCFPFRTGVSKVLKIIQLSYQLKKQNRLH